MSKKGPNCLLITIFIFYIFALVFLFLNATTKGCIYAEYVIDNYIYNGSISNDNKFIFSAVLYRDEMKIERRGSKAYFSNEQPDPYKEILYSCSYVVDQNFTCGSESGVNNIYSILSRIETIDKLSLSIGISIIILLVIQIAIMVYKESMDRISDSYHIGNNNSKRHSSLYDYFKISLITTIIPTIILVVYSVNLFKNLFSQLDGWEYQLSKGYIFFYSLISLICNFIPTILILINIGLIEKHEIEHNFECNVCESTPILIHK